MKTYKLLLDFNTNIMKLAIELGASIPTVYKWLDGSSGYKIELLTFKFAELHNILPSDLRKEYDVK